MLQQLPKPDGDRRTLYHHYHAHLAAEWLEERVAFDTSQHRRILQRRPRMSHTIAVVKDLKAMLYAASDMNPQHYAAIEHQLRAAETLTGGMR